MTNPTEPLRPPRTDWLAALNEPSTWHAEITAGRYGYYIRLSAGLMEERSGWWRYTRRGAERLARRKVAKRNAEEQCSAKRWTVR